MLPPLILAVLLIAAWQIYVSESNVDPGVLPGPDRVVTEGWEHRDELWEATLPTMEETLIGFALSISVGWALAVICDFWLIARRGLMPLLITSQTIPIITIAPLFVIWFGFSTLPKVLVVALVTFFPITVSLIQGFATTPVEATNLLRSMGAGKFQRFRRVRVPTALPYFFSGLRIAITYAVVGAIFGEYVGAERGLGIFMLTSKNARRTDLVLAAVLVTAVLSMALYGAAAILERLVIPWSKPNRRGASPS